MSENDEARRKILEAATWEPAKKLDVGKLRAALEKVKEVTGMDDTCIDALVDFGGDDIMEVLPTRVIHYLEMRTLIHLLDENSPRVVS